MYFKRVMYLYIIVRSMDPEVHLVRGRFASSFPRFRFVFPPPPLCSSISWSMLVGCSGISPRIFRLLWLWSLSLSNHLILGSINLDHSHTVHMNPMVPTFSTDCDSILAPRKKKGCLARCFWIHICWFAFVFLIDGKLKQRKPICEREIDKQTQR